MRRLILVIALLAAAGLGYLIFGVTPPQIILTDARATPGHGQSGTSVLSLTIKNAGPPDVLLSASSPKARALTVMGAEGAEHLTIPGESTALLAPDGAHLMVMGLDPSVGDGIFFPVTLTFRDAGQVTTRAQNTSMAGMDHGMSGGAAPSGPVPKIALVMSDTPSAEGFSFTVETQDFQFVQTDEDAPHVPGQGHAHYYLNGLKLGRLYAPSGKIGPLPPGDHTLRVSLNTNAHMPYMDGSGPVSVAQSFTIDAD